MKRGRGDAGTSGGGCVDTHLRVWYVSARITSGRGVLYSMSSGSQMVGFRAESSGDRALSGCVLVRLLLLGEACTRGVLRAEAEPARASPGPSAGGWSGKTGAMT